MKAKATEKIEEVASKPVAAKPLTKPAAAKPRTKPVAAPKPLAKAAKPAAAEVKAVEAVKVVAVKEAKAEKAVKKPKLKVVRDSFTMPQNEYQKITEIKELCLKSGMQVKKSEVLRAGVIALCAMDEAQLNKAMSALDKIKTGRPNKH